MRIVSITWVFKIVYVELRCGFCSKRKIECRRASQRLFLIKRFVKLISYKTGKGNLALISVDKITT